MTKRKRRKPPETVPVDAQGNVLRYRKEAGPERSGKNTFLAALTVQKHWRHGAARRLVLVDTATGRTYPMFVADFLNMCRSVNMNNGEILGEWGFCKRSHYYGVYLVQDLSLHE